MRMLRLAVAPVVAVVSVVVAQVLNLTMGPQPWPGEVLLSSTWVWTATFLCGPILATIAAWDGARLFPLAGGTVWSRAGVRGPSVRRWWAISTLAAALPSLLVLGGMALRFAPVPGDVAGSSVFTVLAGISTLAVLLGGGLCLGAALGRVYGTLIAFAASLIAQLTSYLGEAPVLMAGGVSDSLLGLRLSTPAMLLQTAGLAALLAAEAVYLFGARQSGAYSKPLTVAVVVVALVAASASSLVRVQRFVASAGLSEGYSCVELRLDGRFPGDGEVCVNMQHQRKSDEIVRAWSQLWIAANRAGVSDFPKHLHELPPAAGPEDVPTGPPGQTATFTLTHQQLDFRAGAVTPTWLADAVVSPTWCTALWGAEPPQDEFWERQESTRRALATIVDPMSTEATRRAAVAQFDAGWSGLKECEGLP